MNRQYYLDLAAQGLRMPIGADLVLRQKPDHEAILLDGQRLGNVLLETADTFHTPLVIHLMDLMLEKATLLGMIGVTQNVDTYHFHAAPTDAQRNRFAAALHDPLPPRMAANVDALRVVAARGGPYVPVGMSIGPVSLMTKLLGDPITPIYMAGTGATAADDPEVATVESVLEMATQVVLRSITAQIEAGAKAIMVAEPAANKAYFSPHQLSGANTVWERYVMGANRRVRALLADHGVDLLFHCCGELVDPMVRSFGELDPAILSLGASRHLWEDAALVPDTTVLYGNLPSKKFYSDDELPPQRVADMTRDLLGHMRRVHHPFILGSECDILSVPGCEAIIQKKVDVMLTCPGE